MTTHWQAQLKRDDYMRLVALHNALSDAIGTDSECYYLRNYTGNLEHAILLTQHIAASEFDTRDDIGLLRLLHLNRDGTDNWRASFSLFSEHDTLRYIEQPYTADAPTPAYAISLAAALVFGIDVDSLSIEE